MTFDYFYYFLDVALQNRLKVNLAHAASKVEINFSTSYHAENHNFHKLLKNISSVHVGCTRTHRNVVIYVEKVKSLLRLSLLDMTGTIWKHQ